MRQIWSRWDVKVKLWLSNDTNETETDRSKQRDDRVSQKKRKKDDASEKWREFDENRIQRDQAGKMTAGLKKKNWDQQKKTKREEYQKMASDEEGCSKYGRSSRVLPLQFPGAARHDREGGGWVGVGGGQKKSSNFKIKKIKKSLSVPQCQGKNENLVGFFCTAYWTFDFFVFLVFWKQSRWQRHKKNNKKTKPYK